MTTLLLFSPWRDPAEIGLYTISGPQLGVYGTDGAHKFFKCLIMWISVSMPSTIEITEEDVEEKALKHYSRHRNGTLVQPQNHPPASLFLMWTLELLSAPDRSSYLQNTCGAPGATKVLHTCDICRSSHRAEARACPRHLNHSQTNQNQAGFRLSDYVPHPPLTSVRSLARVPVVYVRPCVCVPTLYFFVCRHNCFLLYSVYMNVHVSACICVRVSVKTD